MQELPDVEVPERLGHSIAVLPFANTSSDPDNEAFCDGISEEILHRLSGYAELQVIGRTSSFAFKRSDYRIPHIAALLGVRYLLQGSVRRDGDNLRILASLVDETGQQKWSDSFDRKLESVFAVQAEIAAVVAKTVVPHIVPARTPGYEPNLAAYQQYLVGRDLLWKREMGAADALEKATKLDPNFAEAYAELAIALLVNIPELERGEEAVEAALSLSPDSPRALAAKGLLLGWRTPPDPAASERYYREALARNPEDVDVMNWLSGVLKAQGKHDESFAILERAAQIDPLHGVVASNLGLEYTERGDVARAEQLFSRLLEMPEPRRWALTSAREFYLDTGQLVKMNAVEKRQAVLGLHVYYGLALNYAVLGLWDAADRWVNLSTDDFPDWFWTPFYPALIPTWQGRYAEAAEVFRASESRLERSKSFAYYLYGDVLALAGDFDGAVDTLEPLLHRDDINVRDLNRMTGLQALAWVYGETGRDEEAQSILGEIDRDYAGYDAMGSLQRSSNLFQYAQNALLLGDHEKALDRLERAVEAGWRQHVIQQHDPRWAPLRDHPRYIQLMQRVMADVERQRAEVERIDATDDFMERFTAARRLRK